MSRSTDILSRVYRNLRKHGIPTESLQDQEIFDELTIGQDRIISEIFPDKIIPITLISNQDTYDLPTYPPYYPDPGDPNPQNATGSSSGKKLSIASIKIAQLPVGWDSFTIIPNIDFVDYVNKHPDMKGQPKIGTIVDNKLKVYPIPTVKEDGDIIRLYVYISSTSGIINYENDPEIPEYFDKALENYATAQFLSGQERAQYLAEFASDISRLLAIQNRKHHNLTRKSIPGFL